MNFELRKKKLSLYITSMPLVPADRKGSPSGVDVGGVECISISRTNLKFPFPLAQVSKYTLQYLTNWVLQVILSLTSSIHPQETLNNMVTYPSKSVDQENWWELQQPLNSSDHGWTSWMDFIHAHKTRSCYSSFFIP